MKNYYGSLCTEMYDILHKAAPEDELSFHLSYAEKGMSIFEPLCGSGRFLVPFLERGFEICGIDLSSEMLVKLKEKAPTAKIVQGDILEYDSEETFDYIFISSGSVSLFTNIEMCRALLQKMKTLLKKDGVFVFAVDTVSGRYPDSLDYSSLISVKTKQGFDLILKRKSYYDEKTQTQYLPSIYELYHGTTLLQHEAMDFQTHLYKLGEMERLLHGIVFTKVQVYSTYGKAIAKNNEADMFLYECSI